MAATVARVGTAPSPVAAVAGVVAVPVVDKARRDAPPDWLEALAVLTPLQGYPAGGGVVDASSGSEICISLINHSLKAFIPAFNGRCF